MGLRPLYHRRKNLSSAWGLLPAVALTVAISLPLYAESGIQRIRHNGFESLSQGQFGDAGANTYISRRGRLQTINRLDLNRDGELDLVFTQDHNSVYNPDSIIYWGGPEGFRSLMPDLWELRAPFSILKYLDESASRITRLPTQGGGRGLISDLNLDGHPDIVIANFMHNYRPDQDVFIYWGGPSGYGLGNHTQLPAFRAGGVAADDLNGDGFPDLVVANRGDELGESLGLRLHLESYIYWGSVTGFHPERRSSVPSITAQDAAIGDFNGDGFPDLAFANHDSQVHNCFIYWGDGKGGFGPERRQILDAKDLRLDAEVKAGRRMHDGMSTLLATDLDGDGIHDLVAAGSSNGVVFFGSSGGLDPRNSIQLPADSCQGLAAADLNGDGRVDLVFANKGGRRGPPPASEIFWGTEHGFSPAQRTSLPTLAATTVQAADLNLDGHLDLLFGNSRDQATVDVPSYIYWGSDHGFSRHRRTKLLGFGVDGSGVADLDGNGWPDVLLINHLSSSTDILPTAIFWGESQRQYGESSLTLLRPGGTMEYSIADLDDDDFPDLLLVHREGPAIWWGGTEGYSADRRTRLKIQRPTSNNIADLNRDGYLDLLFTGPGRAGRKDVESVTIVWGGEDRFDSPRTTEWDLQDKLLEANAIADLNRDGHLDLVFPMSYGDRSEIVWGGPDGYGKKHLLLDAHGAAHAVPADLDRDGWLDVLFTSSASPRYRDMDGPALIYWGSPEGFTAAPPTPLEGFTSLDASIADFNEDGHLDIALTNYKSVTTREIPAFVYWGDGTRNYSKSRRTLVKAASSAAVDSLDLDRDGWVDLVVSNHQTFFDHAAGTNIFWGSEKGFAYSNRTHLPTIGVHLDAMVDAGNVYTREPRWDFISIPVEAPAGTRFKRLLWSGETPLGTGLEFQVRTAAEQDGLETASWRGPEGSGSFYSTSGHPLKQIPEDHSWLQYRVVLVSPDGGNSPILTEVILECEP